MDPYEGSTIPAVPIDSRTPVIVGAGLVNDREHGSEPIDVMARAAELAMTDAAAPGLRDRIDAVRVVWGVWPYRDPGRSVAGRIGRPDARTTITTLGGNQVYDLVADTAGRIARGELDAAVVCGAETLRTRRHDHAERRRTEYLPEPEDAAPDEVLGSDEALSTATEKAVGVHQAVNFYAMVETAIRHRHTESIDAHRDRIATMWAAASEVAADNPDAWSRREYTTSEIATPSATNRPVASPYPKLMTSNLNVDQGGAVVICSAGAADAAGVPRDRWVFPWSSAGAADHWLATSRWALDESPAMRLAGETALALAGLGVDDCALLDLYSCFPSAVQVAQRELGVPTHRHFTITGGLTFAGGPLNCYCLLPLVRATAMLRDAPRERALLTGNGGYFTKHSMLVLGGDPPGDGYRQGSPQHDVDALPCRPAPSAPAAVATLESYTVTFGRDGSPTGAILACLDPAGGRHWAGTDDGDTVEALLDGDLCGRRVEFGGPSPVIR